VTKHKTIYVIRLTRLVIKTHGGEHGGMATGKNKREQRKNQAIISQLNLMTIAKK
jgi:hypothetical protein